jgi:hypothetical protein
VLVPASLPRFSTLSSLSHTFPITKFILCIICVMAYNVTPNGTDNEAMTSCSIYM